ncbi:bumetanide-sensitive sodium-(potassium)-chloride cotransporter [Bacillus rossius redtenbacheri]|uniref:bumetanide-sensitive sodium-(potassium)-chloride cotransporter n=1 Tax=Bacillus rossius redtenbacheri TaxID=93214 RepID=UPI002FDE26E4
MKDEGRFTVRRLEELPAMRHVPEHEVLEMDKMDAAGRTTPDANSAPCPREARCGRKISLAQLTMEALPRLDNYKNTVQATKRPSMGHLHGEEYDVKDAEETADDPSPEPESHGVKLGWIQGVLIPCMLNIWGVMLFLRLSWVVGQSGIGQSLLIIAISAVVCVLTTLSLSAICTNGEVKGGGIYYIISRSLGPEFGASIGVVFAFANAVAASMNTIGFCDSLNDLLSTFGVKIIDGGVNDTRLVGVVALAVMIVICAVGMEWESKAQNFLIVIIVGAIIDFIAGASVGPKSEEAKAKGFTGLKLDVFSLNWGPQYTDNQDFFSVFAIFFPSVTGIQAGANISGDLKNPAAAIPKGTMLSLFLTMLSYAVFVVFAGGTALRSASGSVQDLVAGNLTACGDQCSFGLSHSYSIMQLMSLWGPFIYAGCFAATLSTALTNLLSVPRLIQALGIDKIYPGLIFFSKGYGKAGEPYRGYVLTFVISSAFLLIANLDLIAPLISNFYLASYALINFCTFHAALIKPLGWRPTFKYYNTWLSLVGFILCVAIMFLINWMTSLITFIIIFALYLIVVYRNPDVNWGSSTQAQTYKAALATAQRLDTISEHVKNYRPQVLALSGRPYLRPALVDLAGLITRSHALLLCGDISQRRLSHRTRSSRRRRSAAWLQQHKIKSFFSVVDGLRFEDAARSLMQASGVGKMRPNVVLMGFKNDWQSCGPGQLLAYFNVLHNAFENRMALVILRLRDGLDYLKVSDDADDGVLSVGGSNADLAADGGASLMRVDSDFSISGRLARDDSDTSINGKGSSISFVPDSPATIVKQYSVNSDQKVGNGSPKAILRSKKKAIAEHILGKQANSVDITATVPESMSLFRKKHKAGTIDVWWLYDDGGFTILVPFIINTRANWSSCKLRVFALTNRRQELELETVNMASLLSKFRIEYSRLVMVTGITEQPKEETVSWFNVLLEEYRENNGSPDSECAVTEEEVSAQRDKTNRQLRLRELLLENSKDAALIFMSLPMPRKGSVSAPLYMAWLEALTRDLPPFILTRGNQNSVLTFYS